MGTIIMAGLGLVTLFCAALGHFNDPIRAAFIVSAAIFISGASISLEIVEARKNG